MIASWVPKRETAELCLPSSHSSVRLPLRLLRIMSAPLTRCLLCAGAALAVLQTKGPSRGPHGGYSTEATET